MFEKGIYVSDISGARSDVQGIFLVEEKNILETKNGAPYAALTLADKTGSISARIWEDGKRLFEVFEKGDFVWIRGESTEFRGTIQVKVVEVSRVHPNEVAIEDFMPHTRFPIEAMWDEFQRHIREIKDPALRALVKAIFNDKRIATLFRRAPAAKRMHHAYIGGLLEHTLGVTRLARLVTKNYTWLNQDLLLTGALLHDIGKIEEFSFEAPPIDYTDKGRLLGHLVIGVNIVERFGALMAPEVSEEKVRLVTHMILSHHGQREFGSPVLPMTEEAVVLHLIDDLDAKLNFMQALKEKGPEDQYKWTDYQAILGRYFFLPGLRMEDDKDANETGSPSSSLIESDKTQSGQRDLWK